MRTPTMSYCACAIISSALFAAVVLQQQPQLLAAYFLPFYGGAEVFASRRWVSANG